MNIIEYIVIGASLSMDGFAISMCSGLKMGRIDIKRTALIALFFGGFQALFPALGWAAGQLFAGYAEAFAPYIAFAILAFLGVKMIREALHGGETEASVDMKALFITACATSVDTLAVGVTFAMAPGARIAVAAPVIGITTFSLCCAGVIVGSIFGARWRRMAQISGGAMLALVGLKILLEGVGIM